MKKLLTTLTLSALVAAPLSAQRLDAGSQARLRSLRSGYAHQVQPDGSRRMMKRVAAAAPTVGGFLTLRPGYTVADLSDFNPEITRLAGGLLLCRVALSDVEAVAAHPAVASYRLERDVAPKMDRVRTLIGVDRLHAGEVLDHPYTGKGVLCSSVDGGFDPNHVNFRNPDGSSRIQNFTYFRPVQTGGYATENYGPDYMPNIDTENSTTFHGTHTLGIMAGGYKGNVTAGRMVSDGNGRYSALVEEDVPNPYYGIACEADLATASGVSTDYYIALGVQEIMKYAEARQEQLGKPYPMVLNISMGSNVGPHDGSSMLSQYLDLATEESANNMVVCIASGNEGDLPISLHHRFDGDDDAVQTGLRSYNTEPNEYPNVVAGQVYVYSDTDEPFELQALVYNKKRNSVSLRAVASGNPEGSQVYYCSSDEFVGYESDIVSPQLAQNFNGYLGVTGMLDTDESGRYFGVVDVMLWETPSNAGDYVILVQAKGKDGQRVDMYTDGGFFDLSDLGLADQGVKPGTTDGTIADTACGHNVVVVGSYNSRDAWASLDGSIYSYDLFEGNRVSPFSSWGTLVDGRELPTVCAPGATVISSTNEYYLEDNGIGDDYLQAAVEADGRRHSWHQCVGTSMSTPVVSGAIALWKEADPTLTYTDVLDIIRKTAVKDADVTADPTEAVKWGAGKFDAFAGMIEVLARQGINSVADIAAEPGNALLMRQIGPKAYEFHVAGAAALNLDVYDMTGALVGNAAGPAADGVVYDASALMPGVYVVSANGVFSRKICVK